MKKLIIVLMLMGCGQLPTDGIDGTDGRDGTDGTGCSAQETADGTLITCGEDTVLVEDGEKGEQGEQGIAGEDGHNVEELIYEDFKCGRVIVRLGETYYLIYSYPIKLSENWTYVNSHCDVRVVDGTVETR